MTPSVAADHVADPLELLVAGLCAPRSRGMLKQSSVCWGWGAWLKRWEEGR